MSRKDLTLPIRIALTVAILLGACSHFSDTLLASSGDAATMKEKVAAITRFGERPTPQSHHTTVTEDEVNAYLAADGFGQLPAGVTEPAVSILGAGRVSARAVVDYGAFRKQKNPTGFDPLSLLGRLPVTVVGILKTGGGAGVFEIESGTVAGVSVPKALLQEILTYAGIGLDTSFALPAHIREIQVERGQAIIVQ